jgi:hypothetical protein
MNTSLVCDANGSGHSQSRCTQQKLVARFLIGSNLAHDLGGMLRQFRSSISNLSC